MNHEAAFESGYAESVPVILYADPAIRTTRAREVETLLAQPPVPFDGEAFDAWLADELAEGIGGA